MPRSVEINNISKSYGSLRALDSVSLDIEKAEIFGLIGPDGAGKTTLFRILTSLLLPDEGYACIEGFDTVRDYRKIRSFIGYMPGRFSLYYDLTVEENLQFFATIFGVTIQENYYLVKDIYSQLEPFKNRKAGNLSGGMKQKLALSCALIHKPVLLILDEPTTGVDAVSRKEFWEMIRNLRKNGITIVVSTPYMDEAGLCDRIALIQKGIIMTENTPQGIIRDFPYSLYKFRSADMHSLLLGLQTIPDVLSAYRFGDSINVALKPEKTMEEIENLLSARGISGYYAMPVSPGIEDCFMELMTPRNERYTHHQS